MAAAGRINHLGNRRGSATLGAVFALGSHVEVDPFTNDGGGGGRLSAGCVGGTEAVGHTRGVRGSVEGPRGRSRAGGGRERAQGRERRHRNGGELAVIWWRRLLKSWGRAMERRFDRS